MMIWSATRESFRQLKVEWIVRGGEGYYFTSRHSLLPSRDALEGGHGDTFRKPLGREDQDVARGTRGSPSDSIPAQPHQLIVKHPQVLSKPDFSV